MRPAVRMVSALVLALSVTAEVLIWRAPGVSAQGQSTANMLVVSAVIRKCFVTTAPLDFGKYDPVQTNATAPLDGQITMTVACTKGAAVTIGIDNGANATGQVRRMAGGAAAFLTYELYQDAARTRRWGNAGGEVLEAGAAPSLEPRQFSVYGRVQGAQDVPVGTFQDTVLVTADF